METFGCSLMCIIALRSLSQVDKRNLGRSLVLPQVECDGLKSVCVFAIGKTIS